MEILNHVFSSNMLKHGNSEDASLLGCDAVSLGAYFLHHCIMLEKTYTFSDTAVRTSNLARKY